MTSSKHQMCVRSDEDAFQLFPDRYVQMCTIHTHHTNISVTRVVSRYMSERREDGGWDQHVRDHCSDCVPIFVNVMFSTRCRDVSSWVRATEPGTPRLNMMFSKPSPSAFFFFVCLFFYLNWQLKLKKRKRSTYLWFAETYDELFCFCLLLLNQISAAIPTKYTSVHTQDFKLHRYFSRCGVGRY